MILNKQIEALKIKILPYLQTAKNKWVELQPREQRVLMAGGIFIVLFLVWTLINVAIDYKKQLSHEVMDMGRYRSYTDLIAKDYKVIQDIKENTFSQINLEQIKGDIIQTLEVKNPDILIQDGMMTINAANVQFSKVIILLDQFRRTYGIFPSNTILVRLPQAGYITLNVSFMVKQ